MVRTIMDNYYNITSIVNSSSLGNLMTNIAPVMQSHLLGNAFLLIIFLTSFLYMKGMGKFLNRSCLMASLSLTVISAIFLFTMGMVTSGSLWFVIFSFAATVFVLFMFFDD